MLTSRRRVGASMFAAVVATNGLFSGPVHAQKIAPGGQVGDNGGLNGSLSRSDLEKLSGDPDSAEVPKDPVLARAKAKARSEKLLKALGLACEVSDARLVVAGTRRPASGGKEVETRVYEVACSGAMGHLLEQQAAENPVSVSCLSAEEARAADAAKGKEPGFFCTLPENKDVYSMVASLIAAGGGAACAVSNLQLFGRSASTRSEYTEVVCKDGKGFLLRTPMPGSQAEIVVTSCTDAAKQGIKCRLTDAGPIEAPVTLDTLKGALAEHGVSCNVQQIRLIGQEDHLKRYVVEYRCADQPAAAVAFVPLPGNTNPYETEDCAAAASRDIQCKFTVGR
ncbi:MAG: hypothetical protein WBF89_19615 [Steroidobacteraceae bacterium]